MKAICYGRYGPPEVLEVKEVDRPIPGENEVLVRIVAASVNPLDWHFMRGTPRLMRLSFGIVTPKIRILGADLAGRVEAVGRNVKQFKQGDEVFGNPTGLGAFAEYVCMDEGGALAPKPANTSFEEAAAIPVAAVTALQSLRDSGEVRRGQRVLINGASGGVGTFTVQLAKVLGAEVTGVCSTGNLELVKSIGADHVIDYTKEDFAHQEQGFDLIIDNVGNRSVADLGGALNAKGNCVIVGYTSPSLLMHHVILGALYSWRSGKRIGLMPVAKPNVKDLTFLKELVESGKVRAVIDRSYPLSKTADAIRYLELGHARGKVTIAIGQEAGLS